MSTIHNAGTYDASTAVTTQVVAHDGDYGPWDGDGPPGFWPIFPVLWFLFIAAIITTVVVYARRSRAAAPGRAGEAKLAELFAGGEISEEEFRARRAIMREK